MDRKKMKEKKKKMSKRRMTRQLTTDRPLPPPILLPSGARDGIRGRAAFHYTRAAAERAGARMRASERAEPRSSDKGLHRAEFIRVGAFYLNSELFS
jgi:hypothetical protein